MRIAVLVKQIPAPVELRMEAGRLVRDGVPLEVNAYCRRANAKAVELAGPGGEVVVFTMGPPSAGEALREMIACGADRGLHLCDPVFAGSDTLATAVALAAALRRDGPFDLVLAGLNSLDSDTGQVPAETAKLLGLPFAAGARELRVSGRSFTARLETDDGYRTIAGELPVALSTAERLCAPSKAPPERCAEVAEHRIVRLSAADLLSAAEPGVRIGQLGSAGSPTSVGPVRMLPVTRRALRASSPAEALRLLEELGAFADDDVDGTPPRAGAREGGGPQTAGLSGSARRPALAGDEPASAALLAGGSGGADGAALPAGISRGADGAALPAGGSGGADGAALPTGVSGGADGADLPTGVSGGAGGARSGVAEASGERSVWCFFTEPGVAAELLGEAAELAAWISGTVTAVTNITDPAVWDGLAAAGADRLLVVPSAAEPSEQADALSAAAAESLPWVLLVEGSRSGRVVASIVAARNRWGLVGDAVGLEVGPDGRLVAWKPAFGGGLLVPILSSSPVQMATVRPGVLAGRPPRSVVADLVPEMLPAPAQSRLRTVSVVRSDDDSGELRRARTVVAVGVGVPPDGYSLIDKLRAALGNAALGATRKVTDRGWVPRSRQIGVTGHAVSPRLLVAVGVSGRFNHTVGIRNAGTVLAINSDPGAEIFEQADVGLVGDWQTIVSELTAELQSSTP